jgi:hypothetical protein
MPHQDTNRRRLSKSFLRPPPEKRDKRLDELSSAFRTASLDVIAKDPRFPGQKLNGPQPGVRFWAPGFVAKAIVMFAAELF